MENQKILPQLVSSPTAYKLIIPIEIEDKIRYLCTKISQVEWSGALFYTYKGSFENEDLEITCTDLFLMDIGSSSYTEFDMSPDVVAYMTEHRELLDCQVGLIHSHNHMATFFSNTDLNTLREEGNDRNHFVSLIVNNEGTYTAAITRKVTREQDISSIYTYRSFNDLEIKGAGTSKVNEDIIVYNMLTIIKECSTQNLLTEIDERINSIKEAKAKPKSTNLSSFYPYKQRTLFDEEYFDSEPPKTYISASMDPNELALSKEPLPEAIIKSYTLQLLTGSIAISDTSKINMNQWAVQMVSLFDKRFDKDIESFKLWIEVFGEFILFNFIPVEYSKYEDIYVEKLCTGIYNLLETLPENKYIKVIKDAVLLWKNEY